MKTNLIENSVGELVPYQEGMELNAKVKIEQCEMTVGSFGNYYPCGRKARFKRFERMRGREISVCGLHKGRVRR